MAKNTISPAIAALSADECTALHNSLEGVKQVKAFKSDVSARATLAAAMDRRGLTIRTIDGSARLTASMATDRTGLAARYDQLAKMAKRKGGIARSEVYTVTGWGKRNVLATMKQLAHNAKCKCKVEKIEGETHYIFA